MKAWVVERRFVAGGEWLAHRVYGSEVQARQRAAEVWGCEVRVREVTV